MRKKEWVCIDDSLCHTAETNTTLESNYISIKNVIKINYETSNLNTEAIKQHKCCDPRNKVNCGCFSVCFLHPFFKPRI